MKEVNVRQKEVDVRQKVESLLTRLGYTKKEITREEKAEAQIGKRKHKVYADFIVSINNKKKFIVETKSSKFKVQNEDVVNQGLSYAKLLSVPFLITCNGIDFALYKSSSKLLLACKLNEFKKIHQHIAKENFQKSKTNISDEIINLDTEALKTRAKKTIKKEVGNFLDDLF